jgi:UDP-N-acetylglucosamine 4,6-dehydratase
MNVARACVAGGVKRCVELSTDKACRAITAYGASNLAMEKLFQAQPDSPTIFTLVRYGNVVASNGSVIPFWRQQAKEGRPISVTRKDASRFWRGEADAVQVVARATEMPAGTITVPKMRSLSLVELAHNVAPGIDVFETGFRSVEKLHEDLVSTDESAIEGPDYFLLGRVNGAGCSYTSYDAPRLMPAAFRAMLAEAEAHE